MIKFSNLGKKQSENITSLNDERLIYINPSQKGFYDKVISFSSENEKIKKFLKTVQLAKSTNICPFWKPIYDPSFDGEKIIFQKNKPIAVGYSFKWWKDMANTIPTVQGRKWSIGTELQYHVFLVWLCNHLVDFGFTINEAIHAVVIDSQKLGLYFNNLYITPSPELTGIFEVYGVYDLGGHYKLLSSAKCSYLEVGGSFIEDSFKFPLAHIEECHNLDNTCNLDTGWYILLDR